MRKLMFSLPSVLLGLAFIAISSATSLADQIPSLTHSDLQKVAETLLKKKFAYKGSDFLNSFFLGTTAHSNVFVVVGTCQPFIKDFRNFAPEIIPYVWIVEKRTARKTSSVRIIMQARGYGSIGYAQSTELHYGYRDIVHDEPAETPDATSTIETVLRFNGTEYVPISSKEVPLNNFNEP